MQCVNAIIIVVYNKKLEDSITLNTIMNYSFQSTKLVIHNNGPESTVLNSDMEKEIRKKFSDVQLVNCLSNYPLSMVYNDFIAENKDFCRFVILDDDSTITEEYYQAIISNEADLELPRIISRADGVIYYPVEAKHVVTVDRELNPRTSFSIGSGLIINQSLVSKFQKHNVKLFDEGFALYGVDVSLFRRIYKLVDKGESFNIRTSSFIMHSLSRTEGKESSFRVKERLIDLAVSTRRYPTIRLYSHLFRRIFFNLVKFEFSNVYLIINSYCIGMHSRCKEQLSRKE
ncbi:glycosyl transferase [Serratia fonticola]|uniref:glycosyltransferase family 2 protein n=1 Tax=Serratia fonticola TaxID=47917 RepID=UPI00137816E2|nr:glycosyl transferase [Serratia fonticola]NBJ33775.1 glycosyl transferase [Serratia fonticola]